MQWSGAGLTQDFAAIMSFKGYGSIPVPYFLVCVTKQTLQMKGIILGRRPNTDMLLCSREIFSNVHSPFKRLVWRYSSPLFRFRLHHKIPIRFFFANHHTYSDTLSSLQHAHHSIHISHHTPCPCRCGCSAKADASRPFEIQRNAQAHLPSRVQDCQSGRLRISDREWRV